MKIQCRVYGFFNIPWFAKRMVEVGNAVSAPFSSTIFRIFKRMSCLIAWYFSQLVVLVKV